MKKNYYLIGSIYGLMLTPFVSYFMLGSDFFRVIMQLPISLIILSTFFVVIAAGRIADKKFISADSHTLTKTIFILLGVYLFGVGLGCLLNLGINGGYDWYKFGWDLNILSWFWKPLYWLILIGAPCAIFVGFSYHYLAWIYLSIRREDSIG